VHPALPILLLGYGLANTLYWNRNLLLSFNQPNYPLKVTAILGFVIIVLTFLLVPFFGYLAEAALLSAFQAISVSMLDWRGLISTTLRTAVFQLQTPWDSLNLQLMRLVVGVHFKMGLDVNDPRSTAIGEFNVGKPTTHEDTTTNPLHALLIFVTAGVSFFTVKRTGRRVLYYQLLVLIAFVAFSFMLKWQIFESRLFLPFFLIAAPAFGAVFGAILPIWAATVVGLGLVASSFMWLVSINPRPLIPLSGKTEWPSVLTASREQMYFTSIPGAYEPMKSVAGLILDAQCRDVGIAISGAGAEYPYWVLLGAPRDDLRIEWIVVGTPSAQYSDPNFQPCAVVCDTCGDEQLFRGLPLFTQFRDINLYMKK
jgi:hypothetical protein